MAQSNTDRKRRWRERQRDTNLKDYLKKEKEGYMFLLVNYPKKGKKKDELCDEQCVLENIKIKMPREWRKDMIEPLEKNTEMLQSLGANGYIFRNRK